MLEFDYLLKPGTYIDKYKILSSLGAGGFGVTYKAEHTVMHSTVALKEFLPQDLAARHLGESKVLPKTNCADDYKYGLERFLLEARTLAKFDHNNIVRIYDILETNGTAYLVMQYVEGQSLDAYLEQQNFSGGMSEVEIRNIVEPILKGLQEIHAAGLLHRDIKPGNIYLKDDGEPMLIDFGAARQITGSRSKSMSAIVSEGYAPVEQYNSKSKQGAWTDIYAVGAVMYQLIMGEKPETSAHRQNELMEDEKDPLIPLRADGYSDELIKTINACLNIKAKDRPQSVSEFAVMLLTKGISKPIRPPGSAKSAVILNDPNATQKIKNKAQFSEKKQEPALLKSEDRHEEIKDKVRQILLVNGELSQNDYESLKISTNVYGLSTQTLNQLISECEQELEQQIKPLKNWLKSLKQNANKIATDSHIKEAIVESGESIGLSKSFIEEKINAIFDKEKSKVASTSDFISPENCVAFVKGIPHWGILALLICSIFSFYIQWGWGTFEYFGNDFFLLPLVLCFLKYGKKTNWLIALLAPTAIFYELRYLSDDITFGLNFQTWITSVLILVVLHNFNTVYEKVSQLGIIGFVLLALLSTFGVSYDNFDNFAFHIPFDVIVITIFAISFLQKRFTKSKLFLISAIYMALILITNLVESSINEDFSDELIFGFFTPSISVIISVWVMYWLVNKVTSNEFIPNRNKFLISTLLFVFSWSWLASNLHFGISFNDEVSVGGTPTRIVDKSFKEFGYCFRTPIECGWESKPSKLNKVDSSSSFSEYSEEEVEQVEKIQVTGNRLVTDIDSATYYLEMALYRDLLAFISFLIGYIMLSIDKSQLTRKSFKYFAVIVPIVSFVYPIIETVIEERRLKEIKYFVFELEYYVSVFNLSFNIFLYALTFYAFTLLGMYIKNQHDCFEKVK